MMLFFLYSCNLIHDKYVRSGKCASIEQAKRTLLAQLHAKKQRLEQMLLASALVAYAVI